MLILKNLRLISYQIIEFNQLYRWFKLEKKLKFIHLTILFIMT